MNNFALPLALAIATPIMVALGSSVQAQSEFPPDQVGLGASGPTLRPIAPKLRTLEAKPAPAVTNLFQNKSGWVGADGAYSIPLGNKTTLWTFGDTWIGAIENGRRVGCHMINNSAAVQDLQDKSTPLTFHWAKGHNGSFTEKSSAQSPRSIEEEPGSLWVSATKDDSYYWPADGIVYDGELYMFLHKIKPNKSKDTLFQFDTVCDAFMHVKNPTDPPEKWRHTIKDLPNKAEELFIATACMWDPEYMYVLCSYPKMKDGLNVHPQILARIPKHELDTFKFEKLQYFCKDAESNANSWRKELKNPVVLFPDGAPELSVTYIRDIKGVVAVYMPPMSRKIMIRSAPSIEGPWSAPQLVYTCPESKEIMVYSVKAHQELAKEPGELVLTYCRNSDDKSHFEKPEIYFPQGIRAFVSSH